MEKITKRKKRKNPFQHSADDRLKIMVELEDYIATLYTILYEDFCDDMRKYTREDTEDPITKDEVKVIYGSLFLLYDYVDRETEKAIITSTNKTIDAVLDNNKSYLGGYGFSFNQNDKALREKAADLVLSGKLYENKWNLSSAIWGDNAKRLQEINKILSDGIKHKDSVYKIAKRLEKYVNPNVARKVDAGRNIIGIRRQIDYNAQRLARTTIQHAYQEAFVQATINNPFIVGYQWEAAGNHPCGLCLDRDGQIFAKNELPLDHPNGACTFIPVTAMSDDNIAQAVEDWEAGVGDEELNNDLDEFAEKLQNP